MRTRPLKRYCNGPPQYGLNIAAGEYTSEGVRLIRTSDIRPDGSLSDAEQGVFVPDAVVEPRHRLQAGDILFSRSGTLGRSIRVTESASAMTFAGFLVRFRPGAEADPRFLEYCANSAPFQAAVEADAVTSTISNFNAEKYGEVRLPDIAPDRQRNIANYLDIEIARIDALISKKQRMIELLTSRTESLLATTLDPIAAKWGEVPLKSVSAIDVSNVDKKSYEGQRAVLLCNYTDVYYNRRIDRTIEFMSATADPQQIQRLTLRSGDVLITKDSETADDIAVPSLVVEDLPNVVLGYHLALLRATSIRGDFLYWSLRSRRCRDSFSLAASGVTRVGLRQDAVGRVPIPNAPIDVQDEVIELMERVTENSERVVSALRDQIGLLREHRQALITAAVTGAIEIPGVAA